MKRRTPTKLLRALSALLTYPDPTLRSAMSEVSEAIRDQRRLKADTRKRLMALAGEIAQSDELEVQGQYVDLFDRGRRTSLNLFEHVHGEGRSRGPAMLELQQRYRDNGLEPVSDQLPDHLPLLLEYLSCQDRGQMREFLEEIAPLVRSVGNALLKKESRYATVMAALLELAGEKGLDGTAPVPPEDDFDSTWQERPAFSKPETNTTV